jgi:hypothetical protein
LLHIANKNEIKIKKNVDIIILQVTMIYCVKATLALGTQNCNDISVRIPLIRYLAGYKRTVRKTNGWT